MIAEPINKTKNIHINEITDFLAYVPAWTSFIILKIVMILDIKITCIK